MSENFDWVEGPAGSGGPLLAGDLFSQDGHELLLPAGYLVFGPADGPYTRVDTGSGLPVSIQNATLAATQSGAWTVTVSNTLTVQATNLDVRDLSYLTDSITAYQGGTWLVQSAQSGTWTVQAVQSGTWNVGTVTALASITNPVTVQDGGGSLTVDGAVTASQGGTWNITNISGVVSLPTGAATAARQDAGNASLASIDGKITACNTGAVTVAASALPAGAATAAKQPAPGVAGTPSADVLTVQGSAGMTALAVSGPLTDAQLRASAVPVSAAQSGTWNVGTVTNVVHVDDNGGSLTVDGTVAATQSGAWAVTVGGTVTADTELTTADLDTGAGTDTRAVVGLVLAASGGGLLVGGANPMPVSDNGGSLTVDGTVAATQSGTWNVGTVTSVTNPVAVTDNGGSLTVDGTVTANQGGTWNVNNVSGTVSLPTGAATSARQDTGNASLASIDGKITACNTGAVVVSSSALPSGAATAVKQPAPGAAGTPSADVLTVQGVTSMTPLKVDGSGVTQPVSGTVTANQGGTWNVGTVSTVTNVVHVDDNSGSLTVDGTVSVGNTVTVQATNLDVRDLSYLADTVTAHQGGTWTVTVSGTVTVADGGGSLTVDGTVAATQSGTWNVGTLSTITNVVHVDDNSGSLTVDGTVAATQSGTWAVRAQDGSGNALTSATRGSERALSVQLVDGSGTQITSFVGTQVTEDVASAADPVGGLLMARRRDTPAVETTTDGDVTALNSTSKGELYVKHLDTVTVGGTVAATQSGTWAVNVRDGGGSALTSATRGSEQALSVQIVDGSGTQVTAFGGGTEYTRDGASGGSEKVGIAGAIRRDTPVGEVSTSGDYSNLITDSLGRLWVNAGTVTVDAVNLDVRDLAYTSDSVTAWQGGQWEVRLADGTGHQLLAENLGGKYALAVELLDGGGNQITSFVGTEYTEDAASTANPTGGMMMARRRDSLSMETTTNGDVTAVNVTSKGEVYVKHVDSIPITDNGGSLTVDGGVLATQSGSWTVAATQSGTWSTRLQDGSGNAVTSHSVGGARGLDVAIVDGSGNQVTSFGGSEAVVNYTAWDETTAKMLPVGGQVLEPFPGGAIPSGRSAVLRMTPYRAVQTCLYTSGGTELTAFPVTDNGGSLTVDGTVAATQSGTWNVGTVTTVTNVVHVDDNSGSLTVDNNGTFAVQAAQSGTWDITNISGTVSLPTGAATAAKQPALGTAGTPSADVITVQGVTSMTPLKVDGSGVTQPVSGTVAATQSGNWSVRAQDGSGNALTSAARGSERALSIQVVDASGNQITSFGGGTEVTEDAAAAADPVGGMLMARRRDSLSTETTTDGDVTAANATAKGELYVKHVDAIPVTDNSGSLTVDNGGTFAVQDSQVLADNAAFTDGTSKVFAAGYVYDEVAGTSLTENDVAAARIDSKRAQVHTIEDGTTRGRYARVDAAGNVMIGLPPGTLDTFGHLITGELNNQIDVQWFADTPANLATVTSSGSGAASQISGGASFATGTAAAGAAKGVTTTSISYRSGVEIYCLFTATFTTPTDGNGYQRIGLYDTNNGFFLGYEGATFKATLRTGASDSGTAKTSFSEDTLTGAAGSRFRRNGTPEAVDFTKLNLFRIRFGWLGAAPVKFEIASPDGEWVTFHIIRQPNLSATPSIATPNLPMTVDVSKTGADATNLKITTSCWGAGITNAESKLNSTLTDSTYAALTRAVITGVTTGGGGGYVNVKVNPSGALTADVTNGGTFAVQANLAATGTLSNVSGSASNVTLLASNVSRRKAVIVNDSSAVLYVKYGTTASTTSYTYLLGPYDTLEETVYTGKIDGIWASATGAARVTEVA